MITTLKDHIYSFDKQRTWNDIHNSKKKYTHNGAWCGVEVDKMDEPVRKMDEFLSKINPITILIPYNLALNLYNIDSNLKEFEGEKQIRTIKSGLGSIGTLKDYKFEDGWHQVLSGLHKPYNWLKCEPDWFAYYFCTEQQWEMINYIFSNIY